MSRLPGLTVALIVSLLASCSVSSPPPHHPGELRINKASPPAGAQPLGPLRAVDGSGCGMFGTPGTYAGALAKLRARAEALGADYIELTLVKEPYVDHQCKHREYLLEGKAYRVHTRPQAAPTANAAPIAANLSAPALAPTASGMLLGASGCAFRSTPSPTSRALAFSARATKNFRVWIDVLDRDAPAFELVYDRSARRLALLRHPGEALLSVAHEPFELDDTWHAWRVLRTTEQLVVTLDGRQVLIYVAPAPTGEAGFRIDGDGLEVRDIAIASPAQ
jgi:hypothetical protein